MAEINIGVALSRVLKSLLFSMLKITGLVTGWVIGLIGLLLTKLSTLIKKHCSK